MPRSRRGAGEGREGGRERKRREERRRGSGKIGHARVTYILNVYKSLNDTWQHVCVCVCIIGNAHTAGAQSICARYSIDYTKSER